MVHPYGFRWRVVLATVAAMTAALVLLGSASVVVAHRELRAQHHGAALEETRAALAVVEERMNGADERRVAELNALLRSLGAFEVVAARGDAEIGSTPEVGLEQVPSSLRPPATDTATDTTTTPRGDYLVTATRTSQGIDYYLFFPLDRLQRDTAILMWIVAITGTVAVVAMLIGTLVASRRVLRPVDDTAEAARQLASGVLGTRVSVPSGSFADLGEAFNDMARALQQTVERLATMEARERQFVADVSHELRTPLTALATAADLFEPAISDLPPGPRRRAAETLVSEVRRLRRTVVDLMEISRLDAGVSAVAREPVSLRWLLGQFTEHHPQGRDVDLRIDGDPIALSDARRLHTIMRNLVDNAVEHGAPPIEITARTVDDQVEIEVTDHGPGVPATARDEIFERFVKADTSRSRTRGSGLGLSIVRDHVRQLGGDVVLRDTEPGTGACFLVTLPTDTESGDEPPTDAAGSPTPART